MGELGKAHTSPDLVQEKWVGNFLKGGFLWDIRPCLLEDGPVFERLLMLTSTSGRKRRKKERESFGGTL